MTDKSYDPVMTPRTVLENVLHRVAAVEVRCQKLAELRAQAEKLEADNREDFAAIRAVAKEQGRSVYDSFCFSQARERESIKEWLT